MSTSKTISFSAVNFEKYIANELTAEFQSALGLIASLQSAGYQAVFAGGCVRDALMKRSPADFDIATNATPDQVFELFENTIEVGKSFGVIILVFEGYQIEIATFRQDGEYTDGRKPDSIVLSTPEKDAQRRDFTVNALFYEPNSNVIFDYVDGMNDLKNRILRTVGDPAQRFDEDKLRLLRAIRFVSQLDFQLEAETSYEVSVRSSQIKLVSMERRRDELKKILKLTKPLKSLRLLKKWNYLKELDPIFEALYSDNLETDKIFQLAFDKDLLTESFLVIVCVLLGPLKQKDVGSGTGTPSNVKTLDKADIRNTLTRLKWSKEEANTAIEILSSLQLIQTSTMGIGHWIDWAARPTTKLTTEIFDLLKELNLAGVAIEQASLMPTEGDLNYKSSAPIGFTEARSLFLRGSELIEAVKSGQIAPMVTGKDLLSIGILPGEKFKTLISQFWFIYLELLYFGNKDLATKEGLLSLLKAPQKNG